VRLAYLDESYNDAYYVMAAVVVNDRSARPLETALDRVVAEAISFTGNEDAELHGHALFHGRDDWLDVPVRARINIYGKAMRAIGEHDVLVLLRGLDRVRHADRDGPQPRDAHDVVLQHVLERLDAYGRRCSEPVLVIADEIHTHERHRADLAFFRQAGTPGYRSSRLDHILDTLHFAPSRHSRLLQAVDLVAFLHLRRHAHREQDPRAAQANDRLWSYVAPRVRDSGFWPPGES
jgi:hypothetical protein